MKKHGLLPTGNPALKCGLLLAILLLVNMLSTAHGQRGRAQTLDSAESAPTYSRILVSTVGGGAIGAAIVGGFFALSESQDNESQFDLFGGTLFAVALGAPIGYWLGQSLGGSWAGSWSGRRISMAELLLPAALWTGVGIAVTGLIGNAFDGTNTGYSPYYAGAAVGVVVSGLGMSWSVHRKARQNSSSAFGSPVSVRLAPSSGGQLQLSGRLRVGR